MTTTANEPTAAGDGDLGRRDQEFGPIEKLRDLVELAGRLAAEIPEAQRKTERAQMLAYLDEVAARKPSRRPDAQKERIVSPRNRSSRTDN
ncbi:MAG: hypothetical protein OXD50_03765 [Chloroflexi bacterium]|nr:hypothetical protein [Chloroflexota bacterium]